MRAYFFTNMYLSSIQNGIQPAHCIVDMMLKYQSDDNQSHANMIQQWARDHKTMVVLNGGPYSNLVDIGAILNLNRYPWGFFKESEEAMNNMLTCVGVILPETIYQPAKDFREGKLQLTNVVDISKFDAADIEYIKLINSCSLAR